MAYFSTSKSYDPEIPLLKRDGNTEASDLAYELIIAKLKDAEGKRVSAGFAGSWGDGGCSHEMNALRLFAYGWNHEFPPEWNDEIKQKENEKDPEYAKFLELKKRFEG